MATINKITLSQNNQKRRCEWKAVEIQDCIGHTYHKNVVCPRNLASSLKELQKIIELSVDVTAYLRKVKMVTC